MRGHGRMIGSAPARRLAACCAIAAVVAGCEGDGPTAAVVPTQLAFTVEPAAASAGASIAPAVRVEVRDASGSRVTGATHSIVLALATNPGGGTLAGTTTASAVDGVATFADLSIDVAAAGYSLSATTAGLTAATSASFTVAAGAATALAFTVPPVNITAGASFGPALQVVARDALNNVATGFTGNITLAIGINPAAGVLAGTTSVAATNGVATFPSVSIAKAASGYTLTASAAGLTLATSAAFDVSAAAAAALLFTAQPTSTTAGATIAPAVTVTAQDAFGNIAISFNGNIAMTLVTNPGGGTLSGATTVAATGGVAIFSSLSIEKAAVGYTLGAAATGLTSGTSAAFDVSAGTAASLAFAVQPSGSTAGATFSPAVVVTARDAHANTATSFTGNVTLAIGTNPTGAALGGAATVAAVNGIASFGAVFIERSGVGYTLTASGTLLTGATSTAFDVTAAAVSQLAFTQQPQHTTAGVAMAQPVQVTAQDAFGNTATNFSGGVTIALASNPTGATLLGSLFTLASGGVAEFSNLSSTTAGIGYTLSADAGIAVGTSNAFDIAPAAASKLAFQTQPTNAVAGETISPIVQVAVHDAFGNTVADFAAEVAVAIGTNPGGGVLAGTTTVTPASGVASFGTVFIEKSGENYTLSASAAGVSGVTSSAFTVTHAAASELAFTAQPQNAIRSVALTTGGAVQVALRDTFGNVATAATTSVTIAIGANPGGATLGGTTVLTPVSGVVSLGNDVTLSAAGTGFTLTASATGLAGATSALFDVAAHGAAAAAVFNTQPTDVIVGEPISPSLTVAIVDQYGNVVSTGAAATSEVTIAPSGSEPGARLLGTLSATAVAGVALFDDVRVGDVNTGYRLRASSVGGQVLSDPFDVTAGEILLATFDRQIKDLVITGSTLVMVDSLGIVTMPAAGGAITRIVADTLAQTGIATDGVSVFWGSFRDDGIRYMRVAIGGGAIDSIGTGAYYGESPLLVDATHLYFTGGGGVSRLLKSGASLSPEGLYDTSPSHTPAGSGSGVLAIEAGGADLLYGAGGDIRRAVRSGGGAVTVITTDAVGVGLAQVGGTMYYESRVGCCTSTIRSVPATGGASAEEATVPGAGHFRSDGASIFSTSGAGLLKVPLGTGSYLTMDMYGAGRVALDATYVYWLRDLPTSTQIYRAPR